MKKRLAQEPGMPSSLAQDNMVYLTRLTIEHGRLDHLHGEVAKALAAQAPNLFSEKPVIESYDILANT